MKAMNFYTANGWAGSNYDSKLSTKEIAAKVRSYAKKNFPKFKFSVRMYTDSLHIELKEGTCIPFVEGARSAEHGCMSTMSSVKAWKDELTPEVFAALNAVSNYASSFRYDDSDGMQDYFDTNFYLSIKVSDEYKVIEPKAKKSSVKPEKVEEAKEKEAVTAEGLVVDYSEKAVAVFGDTKAIKDQLKELGGRFNPALKYNGEKRAGWIFSKKQADKVKELIAPTALPALPEEIYIPELAEGAEQPKTLDYTLYDDYKAGLLTLEDCAKEFCKSGWTNFVDIEYSKIVFDRIEKQIEVNLTYTVEAYEKKVKGKRYTVKDKPLTLGYYGVLDNLDNCIIECYPTKEEAEKEAKTLNGFTDGNGRLRSII